MNIFNKIATGLTLGIVMIFSPLAVSEVEGSVGMSSDYFWRGMSQNAGEVAIDFGLEASHNRFYGGVWASQVDLGNEAEIEYDIYAGVNLVSVNDFTLDLGFIQYNWDHGFDDAEEVFLSASYKMVGMTYYKDRDNWRNSFLEVGVDVPFVDVVDMSINYGKFDNGDKTYSINFAKNLSDQIVLSGMLIKGPKEHWSDVDLGRANVAVGIHYNF